jgi:hypothetical protein
MQSGKRAIVEAAAIAEPGPTPVECDKRHEDQVGLDNGRGERRRTRSKADGDEGLAGLPAAKDDRRRAGNRRESESTAGSMRLPEHKAWIELRADRNVAGEKSRIRAADDRPAARHQALRGVLALPRGKRIALRKSGRAERSLSVRLKFWSMP